MGQRTFAYRTIFAPETTFSKRDEYAQLYQNGKKFNQGKPYPSHNGLVACPSPAGKITNLSRVISAAAGSLKWTPEIGPNV